jgi:hypothetical protein
VRRALSIGVLHMVLAAGAASAHVLHVPASFPSVDSALAAAVPFDTVLVAPGTYVENVIWPATDGIKLFSEAGAAATILDGGAMETVIGIYTGVDTTTVIRGFTIRNGYVHGM